MGNYIRVIKRGRWPTEDEIQGEIANIQAKTIVQEMAMKGEESCLSIWRLDNRKDIALALISPAKENLEKITALKIDEKLLGESGLNILQQDGNSVASDLNKCHYDIVNMNYKNLGDFAKVIMEALKDEANLETITKKQVIEYLQEAVNSGRVDTNDLNEKILSEINE